MSGNAGNSRKKMLKYHKKFGHLYEVEKSTKCDGNRFFSTRNQTVSAAVSQNGFQGYQVTNDRKT